MKSFASFVALVLVGGEAFGQIIGVVGCHVGDSGLSSLVCPYGLTINQTADGVAAIARLPALLDGSPSATAFFRLLGEEVPPIEYQVVVDRTNVVSSPNFPSPNARHVLNLVDARVIEDPGWENVSSTAAPPGLVEAANNPAYNRMEFGIGTKSIATTFNNPKWGNFHPKRFYIEILDFKEVALYQQRQWLGVAVMTIRLNTAPIVPEPATWLLAIGALALLLLHRRIH